MLSHVFCSAVAVPAAYDRPAFLYPWFRSFCALVVPSLQHRRRSPLCMHMRMPLAPSETMFEGFVIPFCRCPTGGPTAADKSRAKWNPQFRTSGFYFSVYKSESFVFRFSLFLRLHNLSCLLPVSIEKGVFFCRGWFLCLHLPPLFFQVAFPTPFPDAASGGCTLAGGRYTLSRGASRH